MYFLKLSVSVRVSYSSNYYYNNYYFVVVAMYTHLYLRYNLKFVLIFNREK